MAQIEQSDNGGKKKKGAQKKIAIHVDFTPMVDMNMLLITFFMLCTTMIKSQTLSLIMPTNEEVKKENRNQAREDEAITLILDTEYDESTGMPKVDAETGKTKHKVYYYEGIPDTTFQKNDFLKLEEFIGNKENKPQGIRAILMKRNEQVMKEYLSLKERWQKEEITKEQFDSLAQKNAADANKLRPIVIIKPGPNTTFEGFVSALDEMQINQISRYNVGTINRTDSLLINEFKRRNPSK